MNHPPKDLYEIRKRNSVQRILNSLKNKSLLSLYNLFVSRNYLFSAGMVLALMSIKLVNKHAKYTLLALGKAVFSDDINAVFKQGALNFVIFPRLLINTIIKKHFANFDELNDGNYHLLMNCDKVLSKIRHDLSLLLKGFRKIIKFDGVISANFPYVSQQELFWLFNQWNFPVIVLYKEGMFPKAVFTNAKEIFYKHKICRANLMLFYNDNIKRAVHDSGMPGVDQMDFKTVGIPRLDKYHKLPAASATNKTIVLFAFYPKMKSQYILHGAGESDKIRKEFTSRCDNFHKWFIQFALEYDEYCLIIKTKRDPGSISHLNNLLGQTQGNKLGNRLQVTASGDVFDLITRSSIVAGYSSTTLLEALLCNRTVISPELTDLISPDYSDLFGHNTALLNYVSDYNHLVDVINDVKKRVVPDQITKQKYLPELIYQPDGQAGRRTSEYICSWLDNFYGRS